jgi:hypothetical protein
VLTSGSKVWRYAYMVEGKRGKFTIAAEVRCIVVV